MIPLTTHPVCVMNNNPQLSPSSRRGDRQSFRDVLLHFHTPETVDLRKSLDQNLQTDSFQDRLSLERCYVLTCGIFF